MLSGLAQVNGRPLGDGAGDHARAGTTFLTGARAVKTEGLGIRAGVSADQIAARELGKHTQPASLEVGIEKLLKAGADPNAARWNGETALMLTAGAGLVDSVELLITKGARLEVAESRRGQTALMWAAAEEHTDVVKLLIRQGADVNATSKTGFSPLAFAAIQNDLKSIDNLNQAGANATGARPDGTSLVNIAAAYGHADATRLLLDARRGLFGGGRGRQDAVLFGLRSGRRGVRCQVARCGC